MNQEDLIVLETMESAHDFVKRVAEKSKKAALVGKDKASEIKDKSRELAKQAAVNTASRGKLALYNANVAAGKVTTKGTDSNNKLVSKASQVARQASVKGFNTMQTAAVRGREVGKALKGEYDHKYEAHESYVEDFDF